MMNTMLKNLITFLTVVAVVFIAIFYDRDTFDPESIRGKRVLITGSSAGIGEELAYQYSKFGASLIITARSENLLQSVALKCKELGAKKVEYVVADVTQPEDRHKIARFTERHLGGLDHLILNHDVIHVGFWLGSSDNMTVLHNQMNVGFFSYIDIASKCLGMLAASKGKIGVLSSTFGKIGAPYVSLQSANKFALNGFFSSLRQEMILRETGVSVTICVLSFIPTKSAIYWMDKEFPHETNVGQGVQINETALAIIKGVTKEAYEIYYPSDGWVLVNIHKMIPGYVEDFQAIAMKQGKHGA